jgi:hypothetical protein
MTNPNQMARRQAMAEALMMQEAQGIQGGGAGMGGFSDADAEPPGFGGGTSQDVAASMGFEPMMEPDGAMEPGFADYRGSDGHEFPPDMESMMMEAMNKSGGDPEVMKAIDLISRVTGVRPPWQRVPRQSNAVGSPAGPSMGMAPKRPY